MDEKMVEKVADNKIDKTSRTVTEMKINDKNIESSYDALKSIDEMEDAFSRLNKNMNRLVDLLEKAAKGRKVSQQLDDIRLSNQKIYRSSMYDLDIRRKNTKKELEEFESVKEEFRKKIREEEEAERNEGNNESQIPQTNQ